MKLHWSLAVVLTVLCGLMLQANLGAGDEKPKKKKEVASKDLIVDGELTDQDDKDKVRTNSYCKTYTFKMIKGHTYQIDMKSKEVDSYLRLENPAGEEVARDDDGGGFPDARITYKAEETGDFKIRATTFGGNSTGKFTLTARDKDAAAGAVDLKLENGKASRTGTITMNDPVYKSKKHKLFTVQLEEGKTYQIDMKSTEFDSYLFLESPDGVLLAQDDDGGGFPNAPHYP